MKPDLQSYDRFVVFFSGGKDSLAILLHLLECGVDPAKIELWHHDVDGREGSTLMDWRVTPAYCQAIADYFGIPLYFSWKVGGIEGEMLRENSLTQPTKFETPEGNICQVGGIKGKLNTRLKFPQVCADIKKRWCSGCAKIDVADIALRNQARFNEGRTLCLSGERAEESPGRAKYSEFEPHRADLRDGKKYQRHIDHWRPVHKWEESEVWAIIERHGINPHPCYWAGYSRCSCRFCIFGNEDQWATGREGDPKGFEVIAEWEELFGVTIKQSKKSVVELADSGTPYKGTPGAFENAMREDYNEPVYVEDWRLPPGAFGESDGPV